MIIEKMKNWIVSELSKPVIPLLTQAHKVVVLVEKNLMLAIEVLDQLKIPGESPVSDTVKTVFTAVIGIKLTIEKTLKFFGAEVVYSQSINASELQAEIDKLKSLL